VDLHAVDEVRGERGLQDLAHVRVVVAEAREPLAGVEVEVGAARRRRRGRSPRAETYCLSKPRIEHVDERRVEMARAASSSVSTAGSAAGRSRLDEGRRTTVSGQIWDKR
jgi:hypothetical protein